VAAALQAVVLVLDSRIKHIPLGVRTDHKARHCDLALAGFFYGQNQKSAHKKQAKFNVFHGLLAKHFRNKSKNDQLRLTNCRRRSNILLPRPQKGLFECVADMLAVIRNESPPNGSLGNAR
jgi:hypothetical protein